MPQILLLTDVCDGMGDFSHLVDVYQALASNPKFTAYEFTLIVSVSRQGNDTRYLAMESKLKSLGVRYLLDDEKQLRARTKQDKILQQTIRAAEQILCVSAVNYTYSIIGEYINPKVPIKILGEHEIKFFMGNMYNNLIRNMGLSQHSYGIKIKEVAPTTSDAAFATVREHDNAFATALLQHTQSADFAEFQAKHLFFPVYASDVVSLQRFVHLIATNTSLPADKDFAICLSMPPLQTPYAVGKNFAQLFAATSLNSVEIINGRSNNQVITHPANPNGARTLRIFVGFWLNEVSFEQLFHCAYMVSVSGDNTFEKAVACRSLPDYFSNSYMRKISTLQALVQIVKTPALKIPEAIQKDFEAFFAMDQTSFLYDTKKYGHFKDLNLPGMRAAWIEVANYLKAQFNFYQKLEAIVLEPIDAPQPVTSVGEDHPDLFSPQSASPAMRF